MLTATTLVSWLISRTTRVSCYQNASILDFVGANECDGGGTDNWSHKMCKAPVKLVPINRQNFYRPVIGALESITMHVPNKVKSSQITLHIIANTNISDMGAD